MGAADDRGYIPLRMRSVGTCVQSHGAENSRSCFLAIMRLIVHGSCSCTASSRHIACHRARLMLLTRPEIHASHLDSSCCDPSISSCMPTTGELYSDLACSERTET